MATIPNISREEWRRNRSTGIGASEAATTLGINQFKSRYALWAEKTGLIEPADLSENEAVEWGTILEEPIAQKYSKATGRKLIDHGRYAVRRSVEYPWMLCTLDREISPIDNRGPGALEIKTTGASHADEWEEEAPAPYMAQLQHQLIVCGWQWGSLAVLIGGQKFRWLDVQRHDDFCTYLIEEEREFWRMVQEGIPPEVDSSASTRKAIERLYPKDSGESVTLPTDAFDWMLERRELKDKIRQSETELARVENRIKAALGTASSGYLPDGSGFKWQLTKRAAYTVPAAEFRTLREIRAK